MDMQYFEMPNYEQRAEIKQRIKDTRSQHYLFFAIGLGLPFVLWLVLRSELQELAGFPSYLFNFVCYGLPPLVSGIFLLSEEREVFYFNKALENGVTCIPEAIVEEVNIPPSVRRPSWGKKSYYNVKIANNRYWVDKKTCNSLSVGDRVELRSIPKTGVAFEIKKLTDGDTGSTTLVFKSKLRPDEEELE